MTGGRQSLCIVTAAYNEEKNLPLLYDRFCQVLSDLDIDWEWIVVDDHSADDTFGVVQKLAARDSRVRGMRFSRNFGSHMATMCGLAEVRSDCAIVMAADLQDPPETIPQLLAKWRGGAEVVCAVRENRRGDKPIAAVCARLYYFLMRRMAGSKEMLPAGTSILLLGRRVVDAVCGSHESNVSILGLIAWMGFSRATVYYDKQPRLHGRSGWTLEKKLKLVADSVTAFSYLPIRLMSLGGVLFAVCGFGLAAVTVTARLLGYSAPPAGYVMIITVLLMGFGFVMTFLGILGEYLWRTFDEVRGRPRYIIERAVNRRDSDPPAETPRASLRSDECEAPQPRAVEPADRDVLFV